MDAIHDYIAQDDPAAAVRLIRALLRRSEQLQEFPESGRLVPDFARVDVRELVDSQYRIVYRVHGSRVDVIAVMHCAQLLPDDIGRL